MPRQIWNEGRVVGYSAYEIYLKQHMATQPPGSEPASIDEWLASNLADGFSMLLKVDSSNVSEGTLYTVDIPLPTDSHLGAANTIVASFFDGEGHFETGSNWADYVVSYGDLISNTNTSYPQSGDSSDIPVAPVSSWDRTKKAKLRNYMKIVDGLVLQQGTWSDTGENQPYKDLEPSLSNTPAVRLYIKGPIKSGEEPLILLSGFTIKAVLAGVTGIDGSTDTDTNMPEDGGFLGPAVYPWANKIIFSVPSSFITFFESDNYTRKIPNTASSKLVADNPVIDMNRGSVSGFPSAVDPHDFYINTNNTTQLDNSGAVPYTVDDFATMGDGSSVLTVYQKSDAYPPALYGTFVSADGTNYLNPLDSVAPGTIKIFIGDLISAVDLANYESTFPGTTAIKKDSSGALWSVDTSGVDPVLVPIAEVGYEGFADAPSNHGISGSYANHASIVSVGSDTVKSLRVAANDGTLFEVKGNAGTLNAVGGQISWGDLISALQNNKKIDVVQHLLTGGNGINISYNPTTQKIVVTNTLPYNPSASYKTLYYSTGLYTVSFPSASGWTMTSSSMYKVSSSGSAKSVSTTTTNYNPFFKYNTYLHDKYQKCISVQYNADSMVKNLSTGLYSGILKLRLSYGGYGNITFGHNKLASSDGSGNKTLGPFRFYHSTTSYKQPSTIMTVKFNGVLSSLNSGYTSWVDTSEKDGTSGGIWDIGEVYGTSGNYHWNTRTGGNFKTVVRFVGQKNDMSTYNYGAEVHAISISDGYNGQYDVWVKHNNSILVGNHVNMNMCADVTINNLDLDQLNTIQSSSTNKKVQSVIDSFQAALTSNQAWHGQN